MMLSDISQIITIDSFEKDQQPETAAITTHIRMKNLNKGSY